MQVSLPADLEQFAEDQVKAGQYESVSDVVTDALRTLRFQHEILPRGAELERQIAEGQAQADRGELLDGEDVFRNLLAHNAKRTIVP